MNDKKVRNVTIKSEPISPTSKKILLSSQLIPTSAIKKEPNSRLPSFKPPRDLFLTGSTTSHPSTTLKEYMNACNKGGSKRKYTPNVNIFRKKASSNSQSNEIAPDSDSKNKSNDKSKRTTPVNNNRKRNVNFIQTKGVFSEGLAPGKVKAFNSSYSERSSNEMSTLEKPKLVLNQTINKSKEEAHLKSILKDDFLDDPNNMPDLGFIPNSLPTVYNSKSKLHDPDDVEKTFKYLHMKAEKVSIKSETDNDDKLEVFGAFAENDTPKLLLFEFPKIMPGLEEVEEKKKSSKSQSNDETDPKAKPGMLSAAGEGHWGYLRIHESGNVYFVVGNTVIPISLSRHIARQEVMSTSIDPTRCRGEVINLGAIDASFTCSTNFSNIR